MAIAALLSLLHLLALILGVGGVFLRGRALKTEPLDREALQRLFAADTAWGVAAILWLSTGVLRVLFNGKDPDFYLRNGFLWVKVAGFGLVFLLELWPMITFIRWRLALKRGKEPDFTTVPRLRTVNTVELVLVFIIFAVAP